jgi:phosphatidylinositol glycan class B
MKSFQLSTKKMLLLALIVHVVAAWFSSGWHHPDEHFQLIEFAQHINGHVNASELPMEFHQAMRPTLQVWLSYIQIQFYHFIGINNPFIIAFLMRLLIAFAGIGAAFYFHQQLKYRSATTAKIHLLLSLFTWALVYVHVRFSSENLTGLLLVLGNVFLFKEQTVKNIAIGFFLLGMAFEARFQTGFYILGIGLYLLIQRKYSFRQWIWASFSGCIAIAACSLLDCYYYQTWTFTPWNYFNLNIFHQVAASFGTEPWYWYLAQINEKLIPPFGFGILAGLILCVWKPSYRMIGFGLLFFLIGHSLVGHKEFRFLFPLAYFIPLLLVLVYEQLSDLFATKYPLLLPRIALVLIIVNAVTLGIVALSPAHQLVPLLNAINQNVPAHAKVYYTEEHPFYSGRNKNSFYLQKLLLFEQLKTDSMPDLQSTNNKPVFVVCNAFEEPSFLNAYQKQVRYSSFPEWLKVLNFNGWMNRSNCYQLYEIVSK